jgi:hypothetical protein
MLMMKLSRVFVGTIACCAALPITVAAQRPIYRMSAADTLRWVDEVTTEMGRETATSGRSDATGLKSQRRMRITLTPVRGDTVKVWIDSLAMSNEVDGERTELPTHGLFTTPFLMDFDRSGRVPRPPLSLQAASPPKSEQAYFDGQFTEFFLPLPSEPLAAGVSWQDSTSTADSASSMTGARARQRETRIRRYRVLRDTTVNGQRALIISSTSETRTQASTAVPTIESGGVTMTTVQTESGFFVFDPAAGRLLGRRLTGETRIRGGPIAEADAAQTVTTVFRYSQRTDAVTR